MATPIQLVIEAVDQAKSVLAESLRDLDKLNRANEASNTVVARATQVFKENEKSLKAVAVAGAAVAGTLALMTKSAITNADDLGKLAQKTGFTVESLSTLQFAAGQSNVSLGEFQVGIKTLSKSIVDSKDPTSQSAKTFQQLGISVTKTTGELKSNEAVFLDIADAFSKMKDGAEKATLAQDLFGRSASELIPLLNEGSAGIRAMQEQAERLGLKVSTDFAKQANQFNDSLGIIKGGLKGTANTIAQELLPLFLKISEAVIEHRKVVSAAFIAITAIVGTATAAFVIYKAAILAGNAASLLLGAGAVRGIIPAIAAMAQLNSQILLYINGSRLANAVIPFGPLAAGVAATVASVLIGIEAWKSYKAAKDIALASEGADFSAESSRKFLENQITVLEQSGKLIKTKADEWRKQLSDAFRPLPASAFEMLKNFTITTVAPVIGFANLNEQYSKLNAAAAKKLELENQILAVIRQSAEAEKARAVAASGFRTDKTIGAGIENEVAVFKARQALAATELQTDFESQRRRIISIREFGEERKRIAIESASAEQRAIAQTAELAEAAAVIDIPKTGGINPLTGKQEALRVEAELAEAKIIIREQTSAKITESETRLAETRLKIDEDTRTRTVQAEQAAADAQISIAETLDNKKLAAELRITEQFKKIREDLKASDSVNKPTDEQLTHAEEIAKTKALADIVNDLARAKLNLAITEQEAARALIENDPNLSATAKAEKLRDVLAQINKLLIERIQLERGIALSPVSTPEQKLAARTSIAADEQAQIERRRRENIQEPTVTPRLQRDLGFQNKLTPEGFKTNERELVEPFRALDDFLANTLTTTFNGISAAITGLITGTQTWGQVSQQVLNSIIGGTVQLVLEYTVFHQIRMLLDNLFYGAKKAQIASTVAVGNAATTSSAATQVAAGGVVAAAWAPAAGLASIASWGAAAIIGIAIVLGALAAIKGGFAKGGIVKGAGGPTEDKVLIKASPGEGIVTADAMSFYGGEVFLEALNQKAFPLPSDRADKKKAEAERIAKPSIADVASKLTLDRAKGEEQQALPAFEMQRVLLKLFGEAQTFAGGGILRGPGGPKDDSLLIRASAGEAILNAAAVNHYGGQTFVDNLNARALSNIWSNERAVAGNVWNTMSESRLSSFAEGGVVSNVIDSPSFSERTVLNTEVLQPRIVQAPPTVNVAPAGVNVAVVKNSRSDIKEFFESSEGRKFMVDSQTGLRVELGLPT